MTYRSFSGAALLLAGLPSAAAQTLSVPAAPTAIAPGDADLFVVGGRGFRNPPVPGTLTLLRNDGAGALALTVTVPTASGPTSVVAADLNADGRADAVVGSFDDLSVYLSSAAGFSPATFYSTASTGRDAYVRAVVVADLTGDGILDLASANDNSGTVSVLPGLGDGTFGARKDIGPVPEAAALATGDVDGDGDRDLVSVNAEGTLFVIRNDGSSTFLAPVESGTAAFGPFAAVLADLDADGVLDLAVSSLGGSVSVRRGMGDGTFGPRVEASGGGLYGITAADLDGDGRPDLAATDGTGSLAISLVGRSPARRVPVGAGPQGVAAADLDGDGDVDLASANTADASVSVRLNAGGGAFPTASETGPSNPAGARSIQAYPNPARGAVTVWASGPVSAYDVLGRRVAQLDATQSGTVWDVSALPPGRYVLRADDASVPSAVVTVAP